MPVCVVDAQGHVRIEAHQTDPVIIHDSTGNSTVGSDSAIIG